MPALTKMWLRGRFPTVRLMGPAEKQRPIRFQEVQLLPELRSSVSGEVAFSISPVLVFSDAQAGRRLHYNCQPACTSVSFRLSTVSIEDKLTCGYPNGRVSCGSNLVTRCTNKTQGPDRSKFNFAHRVSRTRSNKTNNLTLCNGGRLPLCAYDGNR